ncbi:hypothetical protein [Rugamonas aquatica]|uniref:Uncharacterized protein n=1 Tax=Rugamonas aquatica TaxID=2743357 RepID=A0A6A7N714_9BURK|nr:hypothetical protein [Rugamonas aquatica]MQA40672.1 hypothetical protein [Rugamonas aquatica]
MTIFHTPLAMPAREYAAILLPFVDYDAQLQAIRSLLERHQKNEKRQAEEIRQIELEIPHLSEEQSRWASGDWSDRMHASVFADAAHSMSAIGMLAPFIETIFCEAFSVAHSYHGNETDHLPDHHRWTMDVASRWDCRYSWTENGKRSQGIAAGIMQLSCATGLAEFLPADLEKTLGALFAYRNKMLHLGFEWPVPERAKFSTLIANANWPTTWFYWTTKGSEPWICYMTDDLISTCLTQIDGVLRAIGEFAVRKLPEPKSVETWTPPPESSTSSAGNS